MKIYLKKGFADKQTFFNEWINQVKKEKEKTKTKGVASHLKRKET